MNFTTWQIDKMRRGLHAYRVLKAANGQLRPWKSVIDDLITSPATKSEYSEFGGVSDFKEEALRRFAEGVSDLLPDKLDDVASFLLAARVVSSEELSEGADIVADNLLLYRFFASDLSRSSPLLARLSTDYHGVRHTRARSEEVDLRLAPLPLNGFVLAEERVHITALGSAASRYDTKDNDVVGSSVRKGCAIVASHYPTLHIFARGRTSDDFIHYVHVGAGGQQDLDSLLLVRSGAEAPEIEASAEGDEILATYNIVRFTPTTSRRVLTPKPPRNVKTKTKFGLQGKVKVRE